MDWLLTGGMLYANYSIGKKQKVGWILFILVSMGYVFYATAVLDPPQYGLVFGAVLNIGIGGYNAYKWYTER